MGTDQLKELKRPQKENERLRKAFASSPNLTLDKLILAEAAKDEGRVANHPGMVCSPERKALLSPARRRACIARVRAELDISERRACRVLRQHRSTQRKVPVGRPDEERLVADMIELARQYGRYDYRRIAALLRDSGWPPLGRFVAQIACRATCERQTGRKAVAARGAESTNETTQERASLAQ